MIQIIPLLKTKIFYVECFQSRQLVQSFHRFKLSNLVWVQCTRPITMKICVYFESDGLGLLNPAIAVMISWRVCVYLFIFLYVYEIASSRAKSRKNPLNLFWNHKSRWRSRISCETFVMHASSFSWQHVRDAWIIYEF